MLMDLRLKPEDFTRIAAGGPLGAAAELLRAGQERRRVLRVLSALEADRRRHGTRPEEVTSALELLDAARAVPDALRASLGHPSVGLWALECTRGAAPIEHLAAIAAAAAMRARLEFSLPVQAGPDGVLLPGIGVLALPDQGARARVSGGPDHWEVEAGRTDYVIPTPWLRMPEDRYESWIRPEPLGFGTGTLAWRPFVEYADPYLALPEGSPEISAQPLPRTFRSSLARAWDLLASRHLDRARELAANVEVLVPLRPIVGSLANASRPDAFGAVWLSTDVTSRRLAAALIHELEHARLTALHELVPLHGADSEPRYKVAWQQRARPLHALLQGLYAHAAVVEFWSVEAQSNASEAVGLFERCMTAMRGALAGFVDRSALTPAGAELVESISSRIYLCAAAYPGNRARVFPGAGISGPSRTPPRS